MIKINLLGRARPKASRRAVPLEATLQLVLLVLCLTFAFGVLWFHWWQMSKDLQEEKEGIRRQQSEKARLENIKRQVETFDRQKSVLQQRISVIEELQRNRTGGQELLEMVANTVVRTEQLWLTSLARKGKGLEIEGSAGSINAVANFITQLKRSGYFQKVEIKESKQDEKNTAIQTFQFILTADFALPESRATSPSPSATPQRKG
ncbi:MAG: PilN domain-containing protein [Acidobacteria bacterium]|nr:PilN domain-containing protein [Acidobacteriota bacterium]